MIKLNFKKKNNFKYIFDGGDDYIFSNFELKKPPEISF